MLSIARALGEAAPLILVGAITGLAAPGDRAHRAVHGRADAHLQLVRPAQHAGAEVTWSNVAAAAGLVLLVLVLFFNAAAIVLRNRFEKQRSGT